MRREGVLTPPRLVFIWEKRETEVICMTFSAANTIWVLLGAALVFFMQAGFAMCEAGFTRAKNTGNILMKNLMDFCIGTPLYWLFGYGIMFGAGPALFGWIDPAIMKDYSHILPAGVKKFGLTAGLPVNLEGLVGADGCVWGLNSFGFSAPYKVLDEKLGFTAENVYKQVKALL